MTKEEIVVGFRASLEAALAAKTDPKELALFLAQLAGLNELVEHINLIEPSDVKEILDARGQDSPLCTADGQRYLAEVKAALRAVVYQRVS